MTPEEVLDQPPRILSQAARAAYFEAGYVVCTGWLDATWLARVQEAYGRAVERSRQVARSNRWFSLQRDHAAAAPRIQRIERLPDQDPLFWDFALTSPLGDLGADVLGPDVRYRDAMINVKAPGAGGRVGWHQDLPFYPHTNCGTIQVLIALFDVAPAQGPLTVLPGSHRGPVFEHYDAADNWTGRIAERDLEGLDLDAAVALPCAAGDAILVHPLTVHGSRPNRSERSRPLLIHGLSAADSHSYTAMTWGNSHSGEMLRGSPARMSHHEPLRLRLPPDWSAGYSSIFDHQGVDGDA